jgi:hypothetical protein
MAKPKKKKSFWKKAAKVAAIGTALYAGAKGLKGLGKKAKLKGDATLSTDRFFPKNIPHDLESYKPKFVHPPYKASEDKSEYFKKGGRTSKKGGGRTGKQFGGGLNRPVARPVGGVGAPVRPLAYKHGGKVKSMGVAKRGGGIAKR